MYVCMYIHFVARGFQGIVPKMLGFRFRALWLRALGLKLRGFLRDAVRSVSKSFLEHLLPFATGLECLRTCVQGSVLKVLRV